MKIDLTRLARMWSATTTNTDLKRKWTSSANITFQAQTSEKLRKSILRLPTKSYVLISWSKKIGAIPRNCHSLHNRYDYSRQKMLSKLTQCTRRKSLTEGGPTRPWLDNHQQKGALSYTKTSDRVQLDMTSMLLSPMICLPHNVQPTNKRYWISNYRSEIWM